MRPVSSINPKILVLGIGNTLLSDEGIGIHVLNELAENARLEGDIEYLDGGTLSFTLATPIENCAQFIVIDASEINAKPGSVQVFENEQMDHFVTSGNKKSVHEVGLVDVMSIAMLSGNLPAKRALIGIQPDSLDWGNSPTESVQQAIPVACQHVRSLLEKWQS
jgi:hydrogenase maturation protease